MTRIHHRRELLAWIFLPIMLGGVEGAVAGVLVKNAFEGIVHPRTLNVAVAILASAPSLANISSFLWASLSHGRDKIRFLIGAQVATAVLVASIALAPMSPLGLLALTIAAVGARVCWSAVLTIRATVWRANFVRGERATLAGRLAAVQAVVMTAVGLIIGVAMEGHDQAFRLIYPLTAMAGVAGVAIYSRVRVRGHRALVRAEREEKAGAPVAIAPLRLWRIMTANPPFRRYMTAMFLFGTGNLMVGPLLVIIMRDHFQLKMLGSVLIASTIPTILIPLTVPLWSRRLDRMHIVRFRAGHSWAFVTAIGLFLCGALLHQTWLLVLGAVAEGVALGGGVLGWNLGHHDFAPPHLEGQYMGVHVTLTGVRGLIAPTLGVGLYEWLEAGGSGAGPWALALAFLLSLGGAAAFVVMARGRGLEPLH